MSKVWVVVADRSRARILTPIDEVRRPLDEIVHFVGRAGYVGEEKFPAERLQEVDALVHPQGELLQQELEVDRPGRIHAEGIATAYESTHVDRRHLSAEEFVRELVAYLERGQREHRFDRLILVAPPLFLGVLRQHLSKPLEQLVTLEIDKDLTKFKAHEIREHLPREF